MALNLKDHDGLHATVARTVLAGGAAAVAGLFLPVWAAAGLTALAVGVSVAMPKRWDSAAWAVLWACLAGAATQVVGPLGAAAGALALGASVARGVEGRWRRLLTAGVGALGAATAGLIGRAMAGSEALAILPSGIEALAAGAAGGLVVGVSSIGRHLQLTAAPLEAELEAMRGEGELGKLLGRAASAYRDAVEAIGDAAPSAKAAADDLVLKMARFGRQWRAVELETARSKPEELALRLGEVRAKLDTTRDSVTRVELEKARDALAAQVDYLGEIARGRERAIARLMHQVATLERLRLAAVRHRSVDAARLGAELQPVVDELSEAGGEMDLAAEALRDATTALLPPATSASN
jgi:hypothetical protein